jgi:Holliday junction DNA helicase RuvA
MAMMSVLSVPGVLAACARGDAASFTRVPGIGKKLAQRIALELPDQLKKVSVDFATLDVEPPDLPTAPEAQASEGLVALGFPRTEAQLAVAAVRREKGSDLPTDLLIRESLRRLSGGR